MTTDTPGYERASVEEWVRSNVDGLTPPFKWDRLTGGHSNLTYALVDVDGSEAVVRRPPMGVLLPKAHDMGREYKVIFGLGQTNVPVAKAYGFCEDESVTGANFYLMSKVPGRAMYSSEDVEDWLDMDARKAMGHSFFDTLADLHSVDPDDVGLGDLGRKDGYVARQIRTWYGSWNASIKGAQYDDARIHDLHDYLVAAIPEQGPARVVHGDYGPHNCMVARDGTVTAILDWEIATLGDPLADLAYAMNGWGEGGDSTDDDQVPGAATSAAGFEGCTVLAERYAKRTGADLSKLTYYRAFNHFKTGCILHGVYARYLMGQKSTSGVDIEALKTKMLATIDCAVASVDDL